MSSIARIAVLLGLLSSPCFGQTPVDVQPVKELVRTGTLSTCDYRPTAKETPFYDSLEAKERVTGSMFKTYDIHDKVKHYVSWFGIVRGIVNGADGTTTLLLEDKFFDGMTDCHIMLVSREGDGDFNAVVSRPEASFTPLTLVRVYGRVSGKKDGIPQIDAEFLRVWPWLTFTFTDLGPGEDHSNPRWAAYCKVCKSRIYNPYPDEKYYLHVLGDPKDFATAQ